MEGNESGATQAKYALNNGETPRANFTVEQKRERVVRMIASDDFCKAKTAIVNLEKGDVISQAYAQELQQSLDQKLADTNQPEGDFGLTLLCGNQGK